MLTCKPCADQGESRGSIFIWSRGFFHEMHRATAHNRGIFNAEVVHGLQVKCVREGVRQPTTEALEECRGCARLTGKRRKRRSATAHNRGIFNAEVVQGLQVRDVREGVRQPTTEALEECRGCARLTGKRHKRSGCQPTTEALEEC